MVQSAIVAKDINLIFLWRKSKVMNPTATRSLNTLLVVITIAMIIFDSYVIHRQSRIIEIQDKSLRNSDKVIEFMITRFKNK